MNPSRQEDGSFRGQVRGFLRHVYTYVVRTALLIVLGTLFLAPILVKNSINSNPDAVEQVDVADIPAEAVRAAETASASLESAGFVEEPAWLRSEMTPGSILYIALVFHESREQVFAAVSAFIEKQEDLGPVLVHTKSYGEFVSDLTDGTEVRTSNLSWDRSFEPEDGVIENRHEELAGRLTDLYDRHRGHIAGPGIGLRPFPENVDPGAEVSDSARRSFQTQVDEGLMQRGEDGVYRLTWKGAFVMTWRQAIGM